MLRNFVFIFALSNFANGASVDPSSVNCGFPSFREDVQCFMKLLGLTKTSIFMDWKNQNKIQEFQNSCKSVQNCYSSMKCRKTDQVVQQVTQSVKSYCDGMTFLTTNFAMCMQILDSQNSQCWSTYVPVPDGSCTGLFGRNDCLKNEIIETCGQREWQEFRDNMLNLMTVAFPTCNFEKYRNF